MSAPDLGGLVALAESVARLAGDLVREGRPETVDVASTKSSPTDIVTAMDTASEALLRKAIHEERPEDGIQAAAVADHRPTEATFLTSLDTALAGGRRAGAGQPSGTKPN